VTVSSNEHPERILLVGMMGAGKTTVGRMLAGRLGCQYLDSDAEVEAATGRTVPEIFSSEGEAVFRAAERDALLLALGTERAVVSVAGGAVLDPDNRSLISKSGTVVWLRADPKTLASRVGAGFGRPLLGDDPPKALAELDAVRRPLYAQLANVAVDVDDLSPEQVVDAVLGAIESKPS
jgi:shikimate kinase